MKQKQRIQFDLVSEQVTLMDDLSEKLALRSRAELIQQAFTFFLWAVNEILAGQRIISVRPEQMEQVNQYKEPTIPALQPYNFDQYQYLMARSHAWKKQLFLKGRNMTVGQLISTMQANDLTVEETAIDLELPVEQVKEALTYYQHHKTLIELEAQEEAARLISKGYIDDRSKVVSG